MSRFTAPLHVTAELHALGAIRVTAELHALGVVRAPWARFARHPLDHMRLAARPDLGRFAFLRKLEPRAAGPTRKHPPASRSAHLSPPQCTAPPGEKGARDVECADIASSRTPRGVPWNTRR